MKNSRGYGLKLKKLRSNRGLSQEELAQRLGNYDAKYISMLENENHGDLYDIRVIEAFCTILEVDRDSFLDLTADQLVRLIGGDVNVNRKLKGKSSHLHTERRKTEEIRDSQKKRKI